MKKFRPPLYSRLIFGLGFLMVVVIPVLFVIMSALSDSSFSSLRYIDIVIYGLIIINSFPIFPLGFLFPTIGVSEEMLRLYTPWGQYKSIRWDDILEINRVLPPRGFRLIMKGMVPDRALFVKAMGLGLVFKFLGFMYSNGGAGFIIHPKIKNSKKLASLMKQYAPQAFPTK